ncbi:ATP-binding cassette sub-family B member 10, mitochondrial isoform X2 [Perca flavescens]|uniref:ATP-binding cassette sub-family B member 10, mitochondrial isoform X2 n=1 Tax=Perca flavescens TaxID=8167 RepID=UPI00106E7FE9|nr:ATP-binding cassette sub-family B member 10, mitochondrial isoform X2 [Perca flavescens]
MRLLIRMSRCSHGVHLSKPKLPQPRMLWLDHRLTLSAAFRRKRQWTGVKSSVRPTTAFPFCSPGPFMSVLSCGPLRGLSILCPHTPTGRARTVTHTPVAFTSSSAASTPTPAGPAKTQTDTDRDQTRTTVPLEDVKRILQLAHPERWRLAAALGFLTVSSAVTMSAPFFLGKVIDTIYTTGTDTETMAASLTSLCIMLTGVFLCGGAANAARVYLMQTSGQQIVRNLRAALFSSILGQEVAFFDKNRTGELINRLSADTTVVGHSITDNLSDGLRAVAQAVAGVSMMTGLSGNMMILSVLYKGGLLMASQHMTVGELSSFLMYTFWVGISIAGLSSFYSELMKGFGAGARIWELLDRKPEFPLNEGLMLPSDQLKGRLEFSDISFAYPTRKEAPIFQNLSLLVPAGTIMAVVGPSGSGKSTLVSLLLRLYDTDAGIITIDGHDIRDLNPYWLRSHIGTVSQEPVLFSCSIRDNIAYGAVDPDAVTTEDIHRAARVANAFNFIQTFPKGFNTVVGEKGVLLSGGQKQRIAIARALLKNPKILLLDEATSALDAENEFLVQEALERLMEGRTVVIIAHRLSTIQNANAVAVLDQRRIAECGQHTELLGNRQGLFRKLMEKQAFLQDEQKRALR